VERNKNIPPRYAIRLDDLRAWHVVFATCAACRKRTHIDARLLQHGRPPYTRLLDLERKQMEVAPRRGGRVNLFSRHRDGWISLFSHRSLLFTTNHCSDARDEGVEQDRHRHGWPRSGRQKTRSPQVQG
jgi:hypothetical protein